ncbi:acetyl-CoA carboxylase biotin carboxyl carrier protein [Acetanaerobacterium elongatum]|uniref:Biotin carboxyl carrier protein of acetyl-CoA carboxylase n=1 Tax=Acetanaerobacterium elongatum TaxID=258515 RepID=A0A1H0EJW6_9FIRM|nr:acetyl-CoA carboxylase biotin carboxyl carrier protein [Acetanaerobacterium elongatum]SDN82595.1 acetyl-CoA carboxylase biotin carboxyl carrier protein [Acetanaerobacterium elongatum]
MKISELSVENIKDLMTHFSKNNLSSFSLQDGTFSLHLENVQGTVTVQQACAPVFTAQAPVPSAPETPCAPAGQIVKSPIVGTFYIAASPDKPPFVTPGQKVKKGDVLFIIESMKLMNEIQCECDGTVGELLVENGQAVEYGQPIMTII